jgi:hypothetical protein
MYFLPVCQLIMRQNLLAKTYQDEISFFSSSIKTIMSFEYDKNEKSMISLQTTPAPPLRIYLQESQYLPIYLTQHMKAKSWTKKRKVDSYEKEITNMAEKVDAIHNEIQTIMSLINKP